MVVDSKLPRDYRIYCRHFSDKKLDEQLRRHTRGAREGNLQSAACLVEVHRELLRRSSKDYKLRQEALKQRQAQRRADKRARRAKRS